jgi:hypothetical protein
MNRFLLSLARFLLDGCHASEPRRIANLAHDLGPPRHIELLENMVDVMFDRRHAQAQLAADLLVREAAAYQIKDFALPVGQIRVEG